MRANLGSMRHSKTKDRKLWLIRQQMSRATDPYGTGGMKKTRGGPKKVSLSPIKLPDIINDDDNGE